MECGKIFAHSQEKATQAVNDLGGSFVYLLERVDKSTGLNLFFDDVILQKNIFSITIITTIVIQTTDIATTMEHKILIGELKVVLLSKNRNEIKNNAITINIALKPTIASLMLTFAPFPTHASKMLTMQKKIY